jgi:hypothetical protein
MKHAWMLVTLLACSGDGPGAGCPGFTEIVDGTFSRMATQLTWTLEVASIPPEFTFDRTGIPSFVLEYGWGVDVDTNGDNQRDWEVAAKHFKLDGAERVTTDPLSITQENLWRVAGAGASLAGSVNASLAGSTFTFQLDMSEDPDLANITTASQSTWTTFHQRGMNLSDQCADQFER